MIKPGQQSQYPKPRVDRVRAVGGQCLGRAGRDVDQLGVGHIQQRNVRGRARGINQHARLGRDSRLATRGIAVGVGEVVEAMVTSASA